MGRTRVTRARLPIAGLQARPVSMCRDPPVAGTILTIEGQWHWKVTMRVIADLCLIPIGVGVSVSREIAACERVLAEAGLKTKLHAYGTNIEGEWDDVFAAIKRCHEVVHAMGTPRISSSLRFGTRIDRLQSMDEKVRSVDEKLASGS